MQRNKKKSFIKVFFILVIIGLLGVGLLFFLQGIKNTEKEEYMPSHYIMSVDYMDISKKAIQLPWSWRFMSMGKAPRKMGIKFNEIKQSFPHGNTIRVIITGVAFIIEKDILVQSDVDMRVALMVALEQNRLVIKNVKIDRIDIFDFTVQQREQLLGNIQGIEVEFEKSLSTEIFQLPSAVIKIYEMTNDKIIFWEK